MFFAGNILRAGPQRQRGEEARAFRRFFGVLSSLKVPAFVVPGKNDAPERFFLQSAFNTEIVAAGVYMVHRSFARLGRNYVVSGWGGEITEGKRESESSLMYPAWEAEFSLDFLRHLDQDRLLIFHTAPAEQFEQAAPGKGREAISHIIKTYSPHFAICCREGGPRASCSLGARWSSAPTSSVMAITPCSILPNEALPPATRVNGSARWSRNCSRSDMSSSNSTLTASAEGARASKVPQTMRAAAIDRFGGPEVLTLQTLPVPVPDVNEVLIAVDTAGVGSWDADMRAGWSPSGETRFPLVLGTDGSGTIAAVGSRIRRFKIGDPVYAYSFDNPKGGFYAEYVAVPAEKAAPIPKVLDMEHAGAIPTTGLTALQGVDDGLHIKKGEAVIIHGASGGVGTLAVQFAKLRGARVLASASGEDGVDLVRRLGADAAVDGRREDLAAAARSFAPGGVDAVLAFAGGPALERCLDAVRSGGRLAYPNGVEPEPAKRPEVHVVSYDAVAGTREFQRLNRAVEAANLQVPIAASYPLAEAAKAHERLAAGHVLGKIVLRVRNSG